MDALLSSFYFNLDRYGHYDDADWYYYGMPPVSFRSLGASFHPDYSIFFLCDSFYVDVLTMERVKANPDFSDHAALFEALHDTGRLKVIDYRATVKQYDEIIDKSASGDIANLALWVEPFLELRKQWKDFTKLVQGTTQSDSKLKIDDTTRSEFTHLRRAYDPMVPGVLDDWLERCLVNWKGALPRLDRMRTRSALWPYLAHVSATLCLSDCLGAVVHDWADIAPLYRLKLSQAVAVKELHDQREQDVCREILTLMFPDFRPKSARALAKLLDDKRTQTIRDLVRLCVEDKTPIDASFANSLLQELLRQQEKLGRYRDISGWLTMPLSFIPWAGMALEKGVQMAVERRLADRVRGDNAWFFLLSAANALPPERGRKSARSIE